MYLPIRGQCDLGDTHTPALCLNGQVNPPAHALDRVVTNGRATKFFGAMSGYSFTVKFQPQVKHNDIIDVIKRLLT